MSPAGTATVQCRVTNVGERAGDEVVQLYIRDVLASRSRPLIELRGFQRVRLAPGESRTMTFQLGAADLEMLGPDDQWIVEPGTFRVMIGGSSKDIRLRGELVVEPVRSR
jgi:beta-glucosidase